jgi:hypothetical protein
MLIGAALYVVHGPQKVGGKGGYLLGHKKRLSHMKRQGENFVMNRPHDEDDRGILTTH